MTTATAPFAELPQRIAPVLAPAVHAPTGVPPTIDPSRRAPLAFRFDAEAYALLGRTLEVQLETLGPWTGRTHPSPAWVVAVNGRVYIRSRRGQARRWFQELQLSQWLAMWLDGRRVILGTRTATDPQLLLRVTQAYLDKYGYDPAIRRVLHPAAIAATLEIFPLASTDALRD